MTVLTIKKDSAIAQLYEKVGVWDLPTNLCWLFWKTALIIATLIVLGAGAVLLVSTYVVGAATLALLGLAIEEQMTFVGLAQAWFLMVTGAGTCVGLFVGLHRLQRSIRKSEAVQESLIRQYIQAKKQKVCPIVEWEH